MFLNFFFENFSSFLGIDEDVRVGKKLALIYFSIQTRVSIILLYLWSRINRSSFRVH